MCWACYASYGLPRINSPAVQAAVVAIKEVYEWNGAGGALHCQVDDWNLDDRFFEEDELERLDFQKDDPEEQKAAESRCYQLLKAMTLDERVSALAIVRDYWDGEADA